MANTKAQRALRALFLLWFAGSVTPAAAFDDPGPEPIVVDVRALSLEKPAAAPSASASQSVLPLLRHAQATLSDPTAATATDVPPIAAPAPEFANVWDRLRASFGMQELPSPLVKDWENWYSSRPDYVARMVGRAERYLFHILEEIEKRGMPSEIALLPMIESAYNPNAYSTAHASGIWQFIPSTGKTFGLRQNWWQDERRDVLAATRAALDYLEKLYGMFGSWELALASYNWGEGAVGRAIQRNEARGLRTDYLSLDMPAETRNYLPKLMAVKNIVARPESFGLTLAEVPNRPYFTVVSTDKNIDLKLAAKLAEMPLDEFKALNPSHNRPVILASSNQPILVPTDKVESFRTNLEAHGGSLTSWQSYTIGREERIEGIAQRFGISLAQLREINSIPTRLRNLAGVTILVPTNGDHPGKDVAQAGLAAPLLAAPVAAVASAASQAVKHVVKAGETLASIAQRYRLSVGDLAARNRIRNGKVLAGQALLIGEAAQAESRRASASQASAEARRAAASTAKPARVAASAAKSARITRPDGRTQVSYSPRRD